MENTLQKTANQFWQAHFPELIGKSLTAKQANESDFWDNLHTLLEEANADVAYVVLLSNPAMRLENSEMFTQIKRIAKQIWDKHQD